MVGPDLRGGAIEVWTQTGHDRADPTGRGGACRRGEQNEAPYSAEADLGQVDNELGGLVSSAMTSAAHTTGRVLLSALT